MMHSFSKNFDNANSYRKNEKFKNKNKITWEAYSGLLPDSRSTILFLFLIFSALYVYFLGIQVFLTGDAAKYLAITRSIVESGDWINLKIHGAPYDQKPPMLFWLGAIAFRIWGVSLQMFKIPSLIFSIIGLLATFKLGELLYDKKTGVFAVLLLFFSQIYFTYNMDIHTDTILTATSVLALWLFAEFIINKSVLYLAAGFVATGMAMISKGPVGLVIQVFAVGAHLLYTRNFKAIFDIRWLWGIPILFLILLPYLLGQYNQFGKDGILFYFWTNNAGRITGSYIGRNNDCLFYFHTLLYIFLPWSFMALAALFLEIKQKITVRNEKNQEAFLIGGIVFFWAILSVAKGKAPHYFFITFPLLAILTAKWFIKMMNGQVFQSWKKAIVAIQIFILPLVWVLSLIIGIYIFPIRNPYQWIFPLFLGVIQVCLLRFTKKLPTLILSSCLAIVFLNFFINAALLPGIFEYQSAIQASKTFNKEAGPDDRLYNYRYNQYEMFFYPKNTAKMIEVEKELSAIPKSENAWIFTDKEGLKQVSSMIKSPVKIYEFPHRNLTRPSLQFIWPATREATIEMMYLIRL